MDYTDTTDNILVLVLLLVLEKANEARMRTRTI
jgi:hypothetical protein